MNHEGSHSEYFEELCALAASGQISEPEFVELQDHMKHCAACGSIYIDFIDLLHNKLPLADPELTGSFNRTGFFSENSSYRERFLARARKHGLAVSPMRSRGALGSKLVIGLWPRLRYSQVAVLAMALLLAMVAFLGYSLRESNARYVGGSLWAVSSAIDALLAYVGAGGRITSAAVRTVCFLRASV